MILPVLVLLILSVATSTGRANEQPLHVVADVDYSRYAGTWFEIARLPNRFERECVSDVTATYTPRDDGRINVTNRCREAGGSIKEAKGVARRVPGRPPSVLQVRFAPAWLGLLPMVWGDYQIIALASDYSYAMVGTPDRKYLWVLSRSSRMEPQQYKRLIDDARRQGFDVAPLVETRHSPG